MTDCDAPIWGPDKRRLLSLDEAWTSIASAVSPLDTVETPLAECAGHVLAEAVHASDDYPSFDKAMMDGFAVRSSDCAKAGSQLAVVGIVAAGAPSSESLGPGQTLRINTGAPVPDGADAVVMIETTVVSPDERSVRVDVAVGPGQHVEPRGAIRRSGDRVLQPPVTLGPAAIAAAATAGVNALSVYRRPEVSVVVTGDELVPPGTPKRAGQIHDSNGPMVTALMRDFGAVARPSVIAADSMEALTEAFEVALTAPVVVAVGGMSMGTLDLAPKALEALGVKWQWHGVSLRPGKPVAWGRGPSGQHVFGLPGNPVSAFVCSWLFVRMVIRGLQGLLATPPTRQRAILTTEIAASRDARTAFIPGRVRHDPERGLLAEPVDWRGSSDPYGAAPANALLVRDDPTKLCQAGDTIELLLTACN